MAYNYYLGVDPGVNGAVAVLSAEKGNLQTVRIIDVPCIEVEMTTKTKAGKKKKRNVINLRALYGFVESNIEDMSVFAVLEKVHSTPQMGVSSAFNFGYAFGACEMMLSAYSSYGQKGIPYELVPPTKWKKELGLKKGADKEESRLQAIKLFPECADMFSRKKDHNKAEALLLAEYARRLHVGTD